MSLAEHLEELQPRPKGKVCGTCLWYDNLSERDQQWFDRWIAEGWSIGQLWQAAKDGADYRLAKPSLEYHVNNHVKDLHGGPR